MTMSWSFRPTAFFSVTPYAHMKVGNLIGLYNRDNQRAQEEDKVTIFPKSSNDQIRTLQWNIHGWTTSRGEFNAEITNGFCDTIFEADADVMVLNEYTFCDYGLHHTEFEQKLKDAGYSFFCCASIAFPTAIATRWHVFESQEITMGNDRAAMALLIGKNANIPENERIWVIGTHLDHMNGISRKMQMMVLLGKLKDQLERNKSGDKFLLLGDFNQQREEDYTPEEWKMISENMKLRGSCEDDGVSKLLHQHDFQCAWSGLDLDNCNWITTMPPATHWSGTIIDYSYGRNIQASKVSISPAGWSDHRMTVCDWR